MKRRPSRSTARPRTRARTVSDVMVRKVVSVNVTARLGIARSCMRLARIRHLLVLRDGKLVGVLSERDVLGAAANHGVSKAWTMTAGDVMSTRLFTISPKDTLASAARLLVDQKVGCLPVLADDELVGIVTTTDLLRDQAFGEADRDAPAKRKVPEARAGSDP